MICDECRKTIGNSLYERGEKKLCPICVLGEEGKESKYQQFDSPWTETNLAAFKKPPFKPEENDGKWFYDQKNAVWKRKI